MSVVLNQKVAEFEYKGRKYEVDLLLDSGGPGMDGFTYDIFDVTDGNAVSVGNIQMDDFEYLMPYDVVKNAMFELDRLDKERNDGRQ